MVVVGLTGVAVVTAGGLASGTSVSLVQEASTLA